MPVLGLALETGCQVILIDLMRVDAAILDRLMGKPASRNFRLLHGTAVESGSGLQYAN